MKRFLCWLFDHKNTISVPDDNFSMIIHDRCGRCGHDLPVAYPYHREFSARGET